MSDERVVITGLGTVNAVAHCVEEFGRALQSGQCGIGALTVFDTTGHRTRTGAQVKQFRPRRMIPRQYSLKRMSRSDQMAFIATLEALTDAGLYPLPKALQPQTGVVIGGGAGGMLECEAEFRRYLAGDSDRARFSTFASFCCASSADHIATKLELMGPKATFMTACSSGATAIGYARDLIRAGQADVVIAGGAEPLCRLTYAAFNALQAVDPQYCKPFDKHRRGLSLGEGAGILILESLPHARKRAARIYGEVLGYGVSCDAHHMTAPDPAAAGAIQCMQSAMADAGAEPEDIDYINAHGTATPANDLMETRGIKTVFGKYAQRIPVSSTKAMTGHALGAAGAIEGVVSILAIIHGRVPPTIHLSDPDPECDLDYVAEGARPADIRMVLSNSFAFGGNNTAVVYGRFDLKRGRP